MRRGEENEWVSQMIEKKREEGEKLQAVLPNRRIKNWE